MNSTKRPAARPGSDPFLEHVFPGDTAEILQFRAELEHLNLYCQRYKGAIPCVLLTGETGVGKNYTARAISAHSQWLTYTDDEKRELGFYDKSGKITMSPAGLVDRLLYKQHRSEGGKRRDVRRLATVLAPQLGDDLAGSELFGHRKGAFTGADSEHPGVFGDEAVDDVLLDEIGDLSWSVQTKLLQFIDTRSFRPIGGLAEHERTSEHRLFLATNRNLEDCVLAGTFREDLYWRIQGYGIHILPLRSRRDTITDIVHSVLRSVNQRHRGPQEFAPSFDHAADRYCLLPEIEWPSKDRPQRSNWVTQFEEDDLQWCSTYEWPGNVRELRQRLDLYVFRNGHCRLRDVMPAGATLAPVATMTGQSASPEALVGAAVHLYLQQILNGLRSAPRQPRELLEHFQGWIKPAVYRFKVSKRLTKDQFSRLFPSARDAETTVGRWKPGNEQSEDTYTN